MALQHPMKVDRAISEAAALCLESFTECLAVEPLMKNEWAENRLADFNLWVSGTGALARNRASLDSRLAVKPEARSVIVNLLRLLSAVIDDCKSLALSGGSNLLSPSCDGDDIDAPGLPERLSPEELPARSFSPWSDGSVSDAQSDKESAQLSLGNSLQDKTHTVDAMLDQLARIAVAVRQSGRRSRLQKADQRFKPAEHEELEKHLITILLARPEFSKEQLDQGELSDVQRRLIRCNLKRRNRFLYAQHHSVWLDPAAAGHLSQAPAADVEPHLATSGESATGKQKSLPLGAEPSGEVEDATANATLRTGTSATAASDSLALPQALAPAAAASTILSTTVIDLKYPRPPKREQDKRVFMCPCCCQALPVALAGGSRWKKHVAEDLSPYTCVLPRCATPEVLYTTKETWRKHLLEGHSSFEYWVCFSCGDGTQFHSEDDFAGHTRTKHADSVPPSQISLLANICKRSAPMEIKSCPLCRWPDGEEGEVDRGLLLDHIAKDVHSFSLRALPWADDNGQETKKRIKECSDKVSQWLAKWDLSKSPSQERPPLERKVYTSKYFPPNPYFGDSSAASSSTGHESAASWEEALEKWSKEEGSVDFGSRGSRATPEEESYLDPSYFSSLALVKHDAQPDHPHLSPNYFKTFFVEERELGRGASGVVVLVRHEIDGVHLGHYACKRLPIANDIARFERVLVELKLLERLSHQNLVSYRHAWLEEVRLSVHGSPVPCVFILTDYCNSGNLIHYILGHSGSPPSRDEVKTERFARSEGQVDGPKKPDSPPRMLPFEEIFSYFKDITSGLAYLHAANFIHRDLKPSNCLLHRDGEKMYCRIKDFGDVHPSDTTSISAVAAGAEAYCAPEVLMSEAAGQDGNFTTKSDVFSLGMIVYFMCFGELPYQSTNTEKADNWEDYTLLRQEVTSWEGFQDERHRLRPDLPSKLYRLLKRLLDPNPAERPTAHDILTELNSGS